MTQTAADPASQAVSSEPMILLGGVLYLLGGLLILLLLYIVWHTTARLRLASRLAVTLSSAAVGAVALSLLVRAGPQVQEAVGEVTSRFARRLSIPILTIGTRQVTLWTLVEVALYLSVVVALGYSLRRLLLKRVFAHSNMDVTLQRALAAGAGYVIMILGLVVGLQFAGFDMSILAVAAGTLGIGAGFGLQNVAANLAAGLTILIERPFKVGDRIEVEGLHGEVVAIRMRSTTMITNDQIAIIIPNASLVNSNVVNWSYGLRIRRFAIPVGVAYATDPRHVERVLLEVAGKDPDVMKDPAPWVRFREFGDSALQMELMVFTASLLDKPRRFISNINYEIYEAFRREGIQIPFPQRDVHIKSSAAS